jgi:hypothetical protein
MVPEGQMMRKQIPAEKIPDVLKFSTNPPQERLAKIRNASSVSRITSPHHDGADKARCCLRYLLIVPLSIFNLSGLGFRGTLQRFQLEYLPRQVSGTVPTLRRRRHQRRCVATLHSFCACPHGQLLGSCQWGLEHDRQKILPANAGQGLGPHHF